MIADELIDPNDTDDDTYEVHQAFSDRAEHLRLRTEKVASPNRAMTPRIRCHKKIHQHPDGLDATQPHPGVNPISGTHQSRYRITGI